MGCVNAINLYDPNYWYVQTNNPTEEQLRKAGLAGWLETCGASSAANCIEAMGLMMQAQLICRGGYQPQMDEIVADYLNDPRNYDRLRATGVEPVTVQGNRIMDFYSLAIRDIFNVTCYIYDGCDFDIVAAHVDSGNAVQPCLINPGHYLAAVSYDKRYQLLLCIDSWPARTGSHIVKIDRMEFTANVYKRAIFYVK